MTSTLLRSSLGRAALVSILALAPGLAIPSASAQILYQDNFNRADSINTPGNALDGLGSPIPWSMQRDTDNSGPYHTNPSSGSEVEIFNNRLLINQGGQVEGDALNNNDMLSLYVNYNLDAFQQYSISFNYIHHQPHLYSTNSPQGVGSQANGGIFLLPRAQGDDFPGNSGYVIRTTGTTATSALAVYFYEGLGRSGSPANIPLGSLGAALTLPPELTGFTQNQQHDILLDVYGPAGNLVRLTINGVVIDEGRSIGALFDNGTPDHFLLGYNALGTGGRRAIASIDDLIVVVPEPGTWALLIMGFGAIAGRAWTRRRRFGR